MAKKMKWNLILDSATIRYQQIITAYNKGDTAEMEGLCLSSLFGEESELYEDDNFEDHTQVQNLLNIINGSPEAEYFKSMLKNAHPVSTEYYLLYKNFKEMLEDWYTGEPTCMITDKAFQIYKSCVHMNEHVVWEKILSQIAWYMDEHPCEIKAESKEDFVKCMLESILN